MKRLKERREEGIKEGKNEQRNKEMKEAGIMREKLKNSM